MMPQDSFDLEKIRANPDPLERNQKYLVVLDQLRELQSAIAAERGATIYEVYVTHGAPKAAKLLGMTRTALYRVIARHAPEEVKQARKDSALQATAALASAVADYNRTQQQTGAALDRMRALNQLPKPKIYPPKE